MYMKGMKTLEVNPRHPLVEELKELASRLYNSLLSIIIMFYIYSIISYIWEKKIARQFNRVSWHFFLPESSDDTYFLV